MAKRTPKSYLSIAAAIASCMAVVVLLALFGEQVAQRLVVRFEGLNNVTQAYAQGQLFEYPLIEKREYAQLDDKGKERYQAIYAALALHKEKFALDGIDMNEGWELFCMVRNNSPELFYVGDEMRFDLVVDFITGFRFLTFTPTYYCTAEEAQDVMRHVRYEVADVVREARQIPDERERAAFLFKWICRHVRYSEELGQSSHNMIGALVEGKAVCEGYSHALTYLCRLSGLGADNELGLVPQAVGTDFAHAWNAIRIDGQTFYSDPTFGDGRYAIDMGYSLMTEQEKAQEGYEQYPSNVLPDTQEFADGSSSGNSKE